VAALCTYATPVTRLVSTPPCRTQLAAPEGAGRIVLLAASDAEPRHRVIPAPLAFAAWRAGRETLATAAAQIGPARGERGPVCGFRLKAGSISSRTLEGLRCECDGGFLVPVLLGRELSYAGFCFCGVGSLFP